MDSNFEKKRISILIVAGGSTSEFFFDGDILDSAQAFNLDTQTWRPIASLPMKIRVSLIPLPMPNHCY